MTRLLTIPLIFQLYHETILGYSDFDFFVKGIFICFDFEQFFPAFVPRTLKMAPSESRIGFLLNDTYWVRKNRSFEADLKIKM